MAYIPLMVLAKVDPFWSSFSRWEFGVDPLKNFSQLDLTVAVEPLPDPLPPTDPPAGAADVAGALDAGGLALELGLLEQAVIAIVTVIAVVAASRSGRDLACASVCWEIPRLLSRLSLRCRGR